MSFREISIKPEYRSLNDNVVKNFYIPLLAKSILYQRAVGFFSSSALAEISKGITGLIKNEGVIQLVASPFLSKEDVDAIRAGYEQRYKIIENSLLSALVLPRDYFEQERLNLLASLIANGKLDIKIAFLESNKHIGLYHEKMGLLYDSNGNKIAFTGSMNESKTAMSVNYESIDVFCSWKNDIDNERVALKEHAFNSIWNDTEPNVKIIDFSKVKQTILEKYQRSSINLNIDIESIEESETSTFVDSDRQSIYQDIRIPADIELYAYQIQAIDEWEKQDFRGIFDMATWTGKTFTALSGIIKVSNHTRGKLAVIIVCPYQHLVEQWVEDAHLFGIKPIIGYSQSSQKNWKKRLDDAILNQKLKVRNHDFFCFICTNATFSSNFVQGMISSIRSNSLLVIDEAHYFGSTRLLTTLRNSFSYRLALSATLERHHDEDGTMKLIEYFGSKCIEYPLEKAIKEHKLTPYKYYPIVVTLRERELAEYNILSNEISKCIIKGIDGNYELSEKGKQLAIQRARLVAAAEEKVEKLKVIIEPYKHSSHLLVYCGAAKLLSDNEDTTSTDDEELRQIDVITHMLGDDLDMLVSQFTSKEDMKERTILKQAFSKGDKLQALIAIKCLDEGINIPAIKVAFILESTTNPKEYIQRRGRVLRLSENKEYAEIFDFITLPRSLNTVSSLTTEEIQKDLTLVKNEIIRSEEFIRIALNSMQADEVVNEIREVYGINDSKYEFQ